MDNRKLGTVINRGLTAAAMTAAMAVYAATQSQPATGGLLENQLRTVFEQPASDSYAPLALAPDQIDHRTAR